MNEDFIKWPANQKAGFIQAYEGDGICLAHVQTAHTTVLPQIAFALTTRRGCDCGVVVRE